MVAAGDTGSDNLAMAAGGEKGRVVLSNSSRVSPWCARDNAATELASPSLQSRAGRAHRALCRLEFSQCQMTWPKMAEPMPVLSLQRQDHRPRGGVSQTSGDFGMIGVDWGARAQGPLGDGSTSLSQVTQA